MFTDVGSLEQAMMTGLAAEVCMVVAWRGNQVDGGGALEKRREKWGLWHGKDGREGREGERGGMRTLAGNYGGCAVVSGRRW
ncbi:hypothetical protein HAX54_021768 [Datura stramonium]|uniref:Uncharacterized protein n=1 Tax=Datura stramonium TaxID=4076 RepID=A0ABS8UVM6_DATST|nr:hypothetical protein [Datura stramonium]